MEVTEIIAQYKNEQKDMQTSCANGLQKMNKTQLVKMRNEKIKFLNDYNPILQEKICVNRDLCFFGKFPTLATINRNYGENTARTWLVPQIRDLSEFCGCKGKISDDQMRQCATIIAQKYYYLKVSELMLFFYDFKAGKYGKFYGNVDPMVITCSLRDFIKDRNTAIDDHDSEKAIRESRRNGISYEVYCKLRHKKAHNRFSHLLPTTISKRTQNAYSVSQIKSYAEILINNTYSYSQDALDKAIEWFAEKFGAKPAEWLKKNG